MSILALLLAASASASPVTNFARVTVSTGYDAAATTIILATGHGAKLPSTDGGVTYPLVWWNATDYPDPTDDPFVEIVLVTTRGGDTLTVTRGYDGTTATAKNTLLKTYRMMLALTRTMWEQANPADTLGIGGYPDYATAVTKIGMALKTLRIDRPTTITNSITNPNTLTLEFVSGGKLVCPSAGVTVTLGPFLAPQTKIFEQSGGCKVKFGTVSPVASPYWWGAFGDGVTDDTAAIQAAIDAIGSGPGSVYLLGDFKFNPAGLTYSHTHWLKFLVHGTIRPTTTFTIPVARIAWTGLNGSANTEPQFQNLPAAKLIVGSLDPVVTINPAGGLAVMEHFSLDGLHSGIGLLIDQTHNIHLRNVSATASDSVNAIPLKIKNSFWVWVDEAAYNAPTTADAPSIWITNDATCPPAALTTVRDVRISNRGVKINATANCAGPLIHKLVFRGITYENGRNAPFTLDATNQTIQQIRIEDFEIADQISVSSFLSVTNNPGAGRRVQYVDIESAQGPATLVSVSPANDYVPGLVVKNYETFGGAALTIGQTLYWSGLGNRSYEIGPSGHTLSITGINGAQNSIPTYNLRGTATIAGTNTSVAVTFPTVEQDANYFVTASVSGTTGTPAAGATRIYVTGKATNSFAINSEVAPGAGNSVIIDWHLIR